MFYKKSKKLQKRIEKSGLFDAIFYLKTYRDARLADMTPLEHFVKVGLKEDRKPNADFDPLWYNEYYTDVKTDGAYPFIHYCVYGQKDRRFQNENEKNAYMDRINAMEAVFCEQSYLAANPDVHDAVAHKMFTTAFEHFSQVGFSEVLSGQRRLGLEFPYFTEADYKNTNLDIQAACANDANFSISEHICRHGYKEFLKKERIFGGYYPFELNDALIAKIRVLMKMLT